jgi:hypothetical protein
MKVRSSQISFSEPSLILLLLIFSQLLFEVDCFAQHYKRAKEHVIAEHNGKSFWLGGFLFDSNEKDTSNVIYYPDKTSAESSFIRIDDNGAYPLPKNISIYKGSKNYLYENKIHFFKNANDEWYASNGIMIIENNNIKLIDYTQIVIHGSTNNSIIIENQTYDYKELFIKKLKVDISYNEKNERDIFWNRLIASLIILLLVSFPIIYRNKVSLGQYLLLLVVGIIGLIFVIAGINGMFFMKDNSQVGLFIKYGFIFLPALRLGESAVIGFFCLCLGLPMLGAAAGMMLLTVFEKPIKKVFKLK